MKLDQNTKILIAEDEPISRKILHSMLTEFGFKYIYQASNGVEALALGREHKPRYILDFTRFSRHMIMSKLNEREVYERHQIHG